jgi:hypothetical protein
MKTVSIFTYIDRETEFLDLWITYYKKMIPNIHIYILHRSTSLFNLQEYISNKNYEYIYEQRIETTANKYVVDTHIFSSFHIELLSKYDIVLYADVDEFIAHENLPELIYTEFDTCMVTQGVEIIQDNNKESAFNFNTNILSQRNHMIYSHWYDKPVITNSAVNWVDGKHNHSVYHNQIDGLYLIHLGKICIDLFNINWQTTINMYPQHQIVSNDFTNYYIEQFSNNIIEIPDNIKSLIKLIK